MFSAHPFQTGNHTTSSCSEKETFWFGHRIRETCIKKKASMRQSWKRRWRTRLRGTWYPRALTGKANFRFETCWSIPPCACVSPGGHLTVLEAPISWGSKGVHLHHGLSWSLQRLQLCHMVPSLNFFPYSSFKFTVSMMPKPAPWKRGLHIINFGCLGTFGP